VIYQHIVSALNNKRVNLPHILVQFISISHIVLKEKSVKAQPEKMSLELCSELTATDGRGVKVKWQ